MKEEGYKVSQEMVRELMRDIEFTEKMEQASEILGIQLLDHIVIGYNEYTSIKSHLLKGRN